MFKKICHSARKHFLIIVGINVFFASLLRAVDIGSDTAVNRFSTQQVLNTGDRVAGFAWLEGGFRLFDYNTTATFDSVFPVSGDVWLNGGDLVLNTDLYLRSIASFITAGNIIGHNHVIDLDCSVDQLPFVPDTLLHCGVNFIDSANPNSNNVETVDWSFDSRFLGIGTDVSLLSTALFIYEFDGSQLTFRASTNLGVIILSNINAVRWRPGQHQLALGRNTLALITFEVATYDFDPNTFALTQLDTELIVESATAVAWHPSGNFLSVGTFGIPPLVSPKIITYDVSAGGIMSAPDTVAITPAGRSITQESLDWNASGTSLAVGLTAAGGNPELIVYQFTPAPKTLTSNASVTIGTAVTAVAWNPAFPSLLAVGLGGTTTPVRVYRHSAVAGTLTLVSSIGNIGAAVDSVHWNPDGTCLAIGRDSSGGSGRFRTYEFNTTTSQFVLASDFSVSNDAEVVRWSPDGNWVALGSDNNLVSVYGANDFILSSTCSNFSDVKLFLGCDLSLHDCCITISGNSLLHGRGNVLSLGDSCTLNIGSGASVLIEDIIIQGLRDGKFYCIDNSSTITFENTHLILDADYTFSNGRFDVFQDLEVSGQHVFKYTTTGASVVRAGGTLVLDEGLTFSYHPTINSRNRLQFFDSTAQIVLNSATFHTTTTGIDLQNGRLVVDGKSLLSNEGTTTLQGIVFGNGITANNFNIRLLPAAVLLINKGVVSFNNV